MLNYDIRSASVSDATAARAIYQMKKRNKVNPPIEITKTLDNKVIESVMHTYDYYNNIIVPDRSFVLETNVPLATNEVSNDLKFDHSYIYLDNDNGDYHFFKDNHYPDNDNPNIEYLSNSYGNIIQVQKRNDLPITYLYGYNYTLPVAKINGSSYKEVSKILNPEEIQDLTGEALMDELSKLRQLIALVTTYTHAPKIGVTSMTDENGNTTFYVYDDFGRLKYTKDHNNNILQTHQYHYAGQGE